MDPLGCSYPPPKKCGYSRVFHIYNYIYITARMKHLPSGIQVEIAYFEHQRKHFLGGASHFVPIDPYGLVKGFRA